MPGSAVREVAAECPYIRKIGWYRGVTAFVPCVGAKVLLFIGKKTTDDVSNNIKEEPQCGNS
jgi:hypothetical protein